MMTETATTEPTLAECFARAVEAAAEFGPPERVSVQVECSLFRMVHRPGEITPNWCVVMLHTHRATDCVAGAAPTFDEALARCLAKARALTAETVEWVRHSSYVKGGKP